MPPMDVWGVVDEKNTDEEFPSIRLRDPSGRRILIEGLSPEWELESIEPGVTLWCFELKSSEADFRHGARIRPRNFHEYPCGSQGQRARSLALFSDAATD